jgi:hypothetical protein
LWSIFERVRAGLQSRRLVTYAALFSSLAAAISKNKKVVFDFAVVDEAQDITPAHLRFLAALGADRPSRLLKNWGKGRRVCLRRRIGIFGVWQPCLRGRPEVTQAAAPINRGSLMRS